MYLTESVSPENWCDRGWSRGQAEACLLGLLILSTALTMAVFLQWIAPLLYIPLPAPLSPIVMLAAPPKPGKPPAPRDNPPPQPEEEGIASNNLPSLQKNWKQYAHRGRASNLRINTVVDTDTFLPVLNAFHVEIAIDTGVPPVGAPVYLYNPRTRQLRRAPMPKGVIPRHIVDPRRWPVLDQPRKQVAAILGDAIQVYTLYPIQLHEAMAGYAEAALERSGIPPASVALVTVRFRPAAGQNFTLRIVSLEKKEKRI